VKPGLSCGWAYVHGIWRQDGGKIESEATKLGGRLVSFDGRRKYSYPVSGFTALKFLDSDKLGDPYRNDIFVGDFHHGRIYHFDLNESRTGIVLVGWLQDRIADDSEGPRSRLFGEGFGRITDI
jgi:aldose sugar dehydrogenase